MGKRKSFLIHIDSLSILDDLTDEQAGQLFKAIKDQQFDKETSLTPIVKIAFSPFKNQFIRDNEKYEITCKARAIAGSIGGKQKVANASKCKQTVANLAENKNKNKSDNKSDNKRKKFKPPTIEELTSYITENSYIVDSEKFINHYESNGWVRGKTKIKDWKACVRTWNLNNKSDSNIVQHKPRKSL